jgi:Flp pilus assembly protein TadG
MFTPARALQRRTDTGSASVELAILFPLVVLLVFFVVQLGLWYHARHVALAAAEEGARAARVDTGTAAAGAARAERFVQDLGGSVILDLRVSAARNRDTARVEVSGQARNVIPGLRLPIEQASQGPVERFRGPNE